MDYASRAAIRAVVGGMKQAGILDAAALKAIVAAIDEAGTAADRDCKRQAAGELDRLAFDLAADCFGSADPITKKAKIKAETD